MPATATPLELIGERVPLKDDKSRVSIEGVLAGASLAVVLSVLVPELVEAAEWAQKLLDGPGPVESNPLDEGGRLTQAKDQIQIQPLNPTKITGIDLVDLEQGSSGHLRDGVRQPGEPYSPASAPLFGGPVSNQESSGVGPGFSPMAGGQPTGPDYPLVALSLVEDNRYIKVDVASPVRAIGSSVDGLATSAAKSHLVGLDGTTISISPLNYLGRAISYHEGKILKDTTNLAESTSALLSKGNLFASGLDIGETPTVSLDSTAVVGSVARSLNADSSAVLETLNSTTRNSQIASFRDAAEFIRVRASDFIDLLAQAGKLAVGQIINTTTGLSNTTLRTGNRSDSIIVSANTQTDVIAKPGSDGVSLDIGVNTIGLDGSTIQSNKGNDEIQVMAKMDNLNNPELPGFNLNVDQATGSLQGDINIKLNSIGLHKSTIDSGHGNDRIFVDAGIDEYLAGQIGSLAVDANPDLKIDTVKSITSLDNSAIVTGEGDDIVVLRGDVVGSSIDLGLGRNQLVVQGDVKSDSTIKLNDGDAFINIPLYGRTQVLTNADDTWLAKNSTDVSLVLGGDGNDTLVSSGDFKDRVEILGQDLGRLYNTGFASIENMQLGPGNDVVLFKDYGALSGPLDGGIGVDTLSYDGSKTPLFYTGQGGQLLNPGQTNTTGISGFENLVGSNIGDVIVIGKDLAGASDPLQSISLGSGKDLLAFNDVGSLASAWDGIGGAPVVDNLDLAAGDQVAYRYGGGNDPWIIQKDIPALPNDLLSAGIGDSVTGLMVGLSNDNLSNGTLYLTGQQGGNVELAKLRNVTLPTNQNFAV